MLVREECQGCGHHVPVRCPSGDATDHGCEGGPWPPDPEDLSPFGYRRCPLSGFPTREELVRRQVSVELLQPDAPVALDAFIEGRAEYAANIADFERAALYLFNGRHQTNVKRPWTWREYGFDPTVDPRNPTPTAEVLCIFCNAQLGVVDLRVVTAAAAYVVTVERAHLTTCALLYLAGRLPVQEAA